METKKRNPYAAAILSFFTPGLGQLYNGQIAKGAVFCAVYLFIKACIAAYLVGHYKGFALGYAVLVAVIVAAIADAAYVAARKKEITLTRFNTWYAYLLLFFAAGIIGNNVGWKQSVKTFSVTTNTMAPTVLQNERIMVNSGHFKRQSLKQGDVVVFKAPAAAYPLEDREKRKHEDFIKRCVAVSGDTVEIKNKIVYVNNNRLDEPYARYADREVYAPRQIFETPEEYQESWVAGAFTSVTPSAVRDNFGPVKVPQDACFMLGDNRDVSLDSRFFGPVPVKDVKSKALYVYFSRKIARIGEDVR